MRIYTSYFGNKRNIPPGAICVSIALHKPRWLSNMWELPELFPSEELLNDYKNGLIGAKTYTARYQQILSRTVPQLLINKLKQVYGEDATIVLLCYEIATAFCHRHVVAEWLNLANVLSDKVEELPSNGNAESS